MKNLSSKYIGIKYKSHGRTIEGLDCWGLVCLFYKNELGIKLPSWSTEYKNANAVNLKEIKKESANAFVKWKKNDIPVKNSVALFDLAGNFHVGIVIDKRYMLHMSYKNNVTIERFNSLKWKSQLKGFYSYEA